MSKINNKSDKQNHSQENLDMAKKWKPPEIFAIYTSIQNYFANLQFITTKIKWLTDVISNNP